MQRWAVLVCHRRAGALGIDATVVPECSVLDGVNAVRRMLGCTFIDPDRWLEALRQYPANLTIGSRAGKHPPAQFCRTRCIGPALFRGGLRCHQDVTGITCCRNSARSLDPPSPPLSACPNPLRLRVGLPALLFRRVLAAGPRNG